MDPVGITIFGIIVAAITLLFIKLAPAIQARREEIERQNREIQGILTASGLKITKPEKGDIQWIAESTKFKILFDTDHSSDSSTPTLIATINKPTSPENRLAIMTESAQKGLSNSFARKVLKSAANWVNTQEAKLNADRLNHLFEILDRQRQRPYIKTQRQNLVLCSASQTAENLLLNPAIKAPLDRLLAAEKSIVQDNGARFMVTTSEIMVKTYISNAPTPDQVRAMIELANALAA
jgi:hypothetical protein